MFDRVALAGMGDEELISALTAATRGEAAMAARRLALVAEVTARQCEDEDDVIAHQVVDGWAFAKAQVGAACNLSPHAASTQMRIGVALRERLPRTAALFGSGAVSARVIGEITWRTHLVTDEDALALIDAAIAAEATEYGALSEAALIRAVDLWAAEATEYGALSEAALIRAVDLWVEKFDPIAVIRSQAAAKDLYVEFDDRDDPNGVCSFWGRLRATDKQALQQRLNDLADTVCANDPRTVRERRADALGALGIVGPSLQRLACRCGDPGCAGSGKDPRSMAVNIYMLADQVPGADARPAPQTGPGPGKDPRSMAVNIYMLADQVPGADARPAPQTGPGPQPTDEPGLDSGPTPTEPETEPEGTPAPTPEPDAPAQPAAHTPAPAATVPGAGAGVMLDGTVIPAAMLADLIATGAKVRPLREVADLPRRHRHPGRHAGRPHRHRRQGPAPARGRRPAHRTSIPALHGADRVRADVLTDL
ncbi:13E12 repeat family protein [Mycolicibacterium diernhoferi]|uniref:13E12 repeat family protein n=1 Tax=Mycolicibacterium diernhoferi TaxID=1801 RepID=UPI0021F2E5C7|nr:13E12 repeat family protein [Mycolicibacterium diernhoferi]